MTGTASTTGITNTTIPVMTVPAVVRTIAPVARTAIADSASTAPVPTIMRACVAASDGNR